MFMLCQVSHWYRSVTFPRALQYSYVFNCPSEKMSAFAVGLWFITVRFLYTRKQTKGGLGLILLVQSNLC